MGNSVNIADIVASVSKEKEEKVNETKIEKRASLASAISGKSVSEKSVEIEKIAEEVSSAIGKESVTLSEDLEKLASTIDEATTAEDIVKLAEDTGNKDLANLSKVASKITDVILSELETQIEN